MQKSYKYVARTFGIILKNYVWLGSDAKKKKNMLKS